MDVESMFEYMPFNPEVGIEITHAEDGHAEGRIDLQDRHSSAPASRTAETPVVESDSSRATPTPRPRRAACSAAISAGSGCST